MSKKLTLASIGSATNEEMAALDAIIVVDKSGSMGEPSLRLQGKTKWEELREDVTAISREVAKYDADGLTVIAFSSGFEVVDGVKPDAVAKLFTEHSPRGTTNLTDALQAAVDKARASAKPVVVLVFTDGSPNDHQAAKAVIEAAGKEFGRPKIGFVFIQVGNDSGAASFLEDLDNNLTVDVTATVSAADAENLSAQQFVWLAQHG